MNRNNSPQGDDDNPEEMKEAPNRNLTGSLEQCKEELRDAYMNFKDLQTRCILDVSTVNRTDKHVYYFKPDTFLLDDPDRQRYFRESLLKKISAIPKPEPITYMGDEMHKIFLATVADQSRPTICKRNLAKFYKRRQYSLQHLKYKVLLRWAHLAMTAAQMDTGKDAVHLYGKIEYSIEQAMQRAERLAQEDFYDMAVPGNRPNTKAELGEGSLYVENVDLQPQSLLREDDVEIFARSVSYRNKVSKLVNKFMSRLKWLPMVQRFSIFEKAVGSAHRRKMASIKEQADFVAEIDARARSISPNALAPEFEAELAEVLDEHYVRTHRLMYTTQAETIANSWRSDHDNVPGLVNNQHELKLRILAAAAAFSIPGDIELDHGYSFSYRVTVKFPPYFQRQCIKTQFSLYDAFAGDANQSQKHTLQTMTRVDTNIFRDISTTPNTVPDDESLAHELRNEAIKVIRLKSCAYWIDYVCLEPTEPDWHRKQRAILENNNPVDTLTRQGMEFLDVADLASVNRVNEDNALLHQQAVRQLLASNAHNLTVLGTRTSQNEGEQRFAVNVQDYASSANEEAQMDKHLMNAVQGGGVAAELGLARDESTLRKAGERPVPAALSKTGLRSTPQHLLMSFFTLRYMKSKDSKIKILYALNFCRAVQKRFSLDLREFGTRERIDSHLTQPYIHSTDADKRVVTNVNLTRSPYDASDDPSAATAGEARPAEKLAVFDQAAIRSMKNMATYRMYKMHGTFNNKVFSTCPSVPKFHCTFGEPTMRQSEAEERDAGRKGGISKQSLKLMGRVDHIELDEATEEVYVKDDFGVYILYDCVLPDMQGLEEELIRICSHYVHKAEVLQDVHTERPLPAKDRLQTLGDLLELEATFQFKKVKLCLAHLECYEHIVDPVEQQRLMQVVTDIMARRPRLNLQANYFRDSYLAELECLDNQLELVKLLIKTQIGLERAQNKLLQDSLSLSYTLCNQYEENRFKYQDAEALLQAVAARHKQDRAARRYAEVIRKETVRKAEPGQSAGGVQGIQEADQEAEADAVEEASAADESVSATNSRPGTQAAEGQTPPAPVAEATAGGEGEKSIAEAENSDDSAIAAGEAELERLNAQENVFQQLLGLPEISLDTLYQAYREKDKTILHFMNEHTNFIQIHEGYPEFLTFQQGGKGGKAMRNFKPTPWSEPVYNLDFYDSLGFINKFTAIMQQISQELHDALKPFDPTIMTYIDAHVAKAALEEFRRVQEVMEGSETEYEGRQYLEDESVMGNADKMVFYAKEMLSQLTLGGKGTLDPYLVAKLSVNTINFFDFPRLPKSENKYVHQFQDGVGPAEWVVNMHKAALFDSAKRKSSDRAKALDNIIGAGSLLVGSRNVDVPSQLQTYCNMVELMRLRHEIILAASECAVLQDVYLEQAKVCGVKGLSVFLPDFINFDVVDIHEDQRELINFFEEGTSHSVKIGLAVREYDPSLLANFNFRNPDTFKLNITDAGLEEVRAVLTYQLLQKHLLIVATRTNQLLLDNSLKALSEVDLLQGLGIATPNSTFDVASVFARNSDNLSTSALRAVQTKFGNNMRGQIANVFYQVTERKRKLRTDIAKEYSHYLSAVSRVHMGKNQCVQRVMRSFKVKQLIRYCENILLEVHLDAQKAQAVQVCQRLRTLSQYFSFDPAQFKMTVIQKGKPGEPRKEDYQVFEYETNPMIENFTYPYMPRDEEIDHLDPEAAAKEVKALDPSSLAILDVCAIPSSATLLGAEASPIEELRAFKLKLAKVHKAYNANYKEDLRQLDEMVNEPERQTREMLPTMTPRETDPSQGKGRPEDSEIDKLGYPMLDYEEALNFGRSKYGVMMRFYQYLERILGLEWFICKLQFRQDTVVHMDNAITLGLPFWTPTDYERRMKKEVKALPIKKGVNPISQDFLHSNIESKKTKAYIAEEVSSVSLTLQNLLRAYRATKDERKYEYLNSYTEFRYMQVLGSFHKIIQQFYIQRRGGNGISSLRAAISKLAKVDHVRLSYSNGNSYHVNTALVHPQMQLLESTNMIFGALSEDDHQNFQRCVQPVINEKALEPPQLSLFQSLYQTDSFRRRMPTQFAGQLVSTHNTCSFKSLETALLEMTQEDRTYAQSFIMQARDQANDYMEIALDPSLAGMPTDEVYNVDQLADAKKYLQDGTQSLLLKNAIICWKENQVLPDSAAVYAKFEENFRESFFWKIIEHKENMVTSRMARSDGGGIPTQKQLAQLQQQIDDLQANYSLATATEDEHRLAMIDKLQAEFRAQKKKVTLDGHYSTRAEIAVLSNEIEKLLTRASVQTLDAENAALTRCFTLSQPKLQFRIHPFQQFAATLFDRVDVQSHLDMVVKLGFVQEFLTKLGNRGTEVETLTSGPGVVFTRKDFNDAIQGFCRKIIIYGEQELKSRSDLAFQKEEHYRQLIYVKDQKIASIEDRIRRQSKNIENIISAKLFEKGNQLIYELDSTSRLLILFKQTMYGLENKIRSTILGEQAQRFKLQKDALDTQIEKLEEYKRHVSQIVGVKFSQDYAKIMEQLKRTVEKVHSNSSDIMTTYVPPTLYPASGGPQFRSPVQQIVIKTEHGEDERRNGGGFGGSGGGSFPGIASGASLGSNTSNIAKLAAGAASTSGVILDSLLLEAVGTLPGSVVPSGFQHYTHCSCFQPSKKYPNYTMEHAELEMYSEQEARFELARMCEAMRKQRLFWRTKEMLTKQKFQNKLNLMKKQLSNNAYLWDQMAESEKRETILKQELLFTQQSLSAAEKVIEKLQEEMKKVEADRQRLQKYKHSKAERLKELEDKIKKFEVYATVDTDKLISALSRKDEECKQLAGAARDATSHISMVEHTKSKEVGQVKNRLFREQAKTQQIVEKMEQMKLELKMLESNDTSVASIWKKKCLDLFEVCQTLKSENEELRDRCKELIVQGIQLADAVNQEDSQQSLILASQPQQPQQSLYKVQQSGNHVSLPKLQTNKSVKRMNQELAGLYTRATPAAANASSGHLATSTDASYELASNLGFPGERSRMQNGFQSAQGRHADDSSNPTDSGLGLQMQSPYASSGVNVLQKRALGQSFDQNASVAAAHKKAALNLAKAANLLRSPQGNLIGSKPAGARHGSHGRNSRLPQTQDAHLRGRTTGGASGPTYYMPGSTGDINQPSSRQKPRQDTRSIMSSGAKDPLAENSFSQSFQASSDKFGSTVRSQIQQQQLQANQQQLAGLYTQATPVASFEARGKRQQHLIAGSGALEKHNDSLFESSKASASNYQTSLMRRQFNKGHRRDDNISARPTALSNQRRPGEMLGAAVFGSKMRPSRQPDAVHASGTATVMKASTKPGSQVTELTSNQHRHLPSEMALKNADDSFMGQEASFAAPGGHDDQFIINTEGNEGK